MQRLAWCCGTISRAPIRPPAQLFVIPAGTNATITSTWARQTFGPASILAPLRCFSFSPVRRYLNDDDDNENPSPDDLDDEMEMDEIEEEEEDEKAKSKSAAAQKRKQSKYAAENAELEFLKNAMIWHYKAKHEPRPMLAEETKEEMYRLHKENPKDWNLEHLSLKFGLRKSRVKAILIFMGMREEAQRNGEVLHDGVVRLLEEEFGVVKRFADKRLLSEEKLDTHPAQAQPIEEDADQEALTNHALAICSFSFSFPLPHWPLQGHHVSAHTAPSFLYSSPTNSYY